MTGSSVDPADEEDNFGIPAMVGVTVVIGAKAPVVIIPQTRLSDWVDRLNFVVLVKELEVELKLI